MRRTLRKRAGLRPGRPVRGGDEIAHLNTRLLDSLETVLQRLYPAGQVKRHEFVIGDVDGTPGQSLRVRLSGPKRGLWYDFATNAGGDAISLWAAAQGLDPKREFSEVVRRLRAEFGAGAAPQLDYVPTVASTRGPRDLGPVSAHWNYLDPDGQIIASVLRYDGPDGKSYRPWDPRRNRFGTPDPRPLYNLPAVLESSHVVLVEGEKCAQALIDAGIVATTTMQGARAPASKTDWSPLKGKHVVIWPDNDDPGRHYAQATADACRAAGCAAVDVLVPPRDKPTAWDAADAIAEGFDWKNFLATGAREARSSPAAHVRHFTLGEVLDDRSPIPPDLIAPRVLTPAGMLVFGGAPKVGKSDFLLTFLTHMAAGQPFLGLMPPRPLRVFYLQAEVHYHYLRERAQMLVLPPEAMAVARNHLVVTPQLKLLLDETGVREVAKAASHAFAPNTVDVIAIDPIRNVYDGGEFGGENENSAMQFFLSQRVDVLRDMVNPAAGVILVHHTRKLAKRQLEEDPFQALAGAGSLRGYYSSGMLLFRPDESSSVRQLFFELRNGPALAMKHVDKIDGRWEEVDPGTRLVMREHGARLDAERRRKRDVILEIVHAEAAQGRCYTANQFAEAFEGRSGLGGERSIRDRIAVLATQGYIKFFRNALDFGLPLPGRSRFGYLCVEGMEILRKTGVDAQTGEVATAVLPVLPTHYRCPSTGASLPVENPSVWVYPQEQLGG